MLFLDFTVVGFGLWFDIRFPIFLFNVLSAIGLGFVVLGLLLNVSYRSLGMAGVIILVFHNLMPVLPLADGSIVKTIFAPLFSGTVIPFGNEKMFIMGYPPIPWLGILLTGFGAGEWFQLPDEQRKNVFLKAGLLSLGAFLILRLINIYGDPVGWKVQNDGWFTLISFLNVSKYPPSLLFCLLILGIMFLLLLAAEKIHKSKTGFLEVYGRVPLFYFVIHWYLLHALLFAILYIQGYRSSDFEFGFNFGRPKEWTGLNLASTYLVWITVVAVLFPLCQWYGKLKVKHQEWLKYL